MVEDFEDDDFDAQFEDDENSEEPVEEPVEDEPVEEEGEPQEEGRDSSQEEEEEQEFDKPVSEGEIVELEIEDLGSKGDGIARVEGFVVFVPGGEVDESYDVEITSVGNKFAFGEIAD
ncbi:MAG: TRAM domain-containing protein [Candidatus Nanohalobium sp.]